METLLPPITGRVQAYCINPMGRWIPATPKGCNDVLFEWAGAAAQLLTNGRTEYRISGIYFEYENVADPADTVSAPTFSRSDGFDYYHSTLASDADRDFLRVPVLASRIDSTDPDKFPDGNLLTFYAQTQGMTGFHGLPFSDADNSKVFGGALAVMPSLSDASRDIVFSRFYFDPSEQQVKLASSQIGFSWELELQ